MYGETRAYQRSLENLQVVLRAALEVGTGWQNRVLRTLFREKGDIEMDLKIAVTPEGYDDIGTVIRKLEYKFKKINESSLDDASKLSLFDVVFINCSSSCETNASRAQKALQRYVNQGGTLYASDYAADYIAGAFPGFVEFVGKHGKQGKMTAQIVDKGLRGLMGSSISLTFDLNSWEQIKRVEKSVRVYLEHAGKPLLVSFECGKGNVIYTCFHNHAQVSDKEAELLRFLVLKPLMASATAEVVDFREWEKKEVQETIGMISPEGTSPWYTYQFTSPGSLSIALNWKGEANLRLELEGPSGGWHKDGTVPPLSLQIPSAPRGIWKYRVAGISVPMKNFPFVVLSGPSSQVAVSSTGTAPLFHWDRAVVQTEADPTVLDSIKILDSCVLTHSG